MKSPYTTAGWIAWHGRDKSPFREGIKVRVRYRGYPDRLDDVINAGMYPLTGWAHCGTHRDIVAFKFLPAD